MRRSTKTSLAIGLLGAALAAACDENPESSLRYGTIEVLTNAPTAENDITTVDGWTIKVDKLLVHVSSIEVSGLDGILTASAEGQIVDQVTPGPKLLLEAPARLARPWELFTFTIGPATADSTVLESATEEDAAAMIAGGLSILLEATATRGGDTKKIRWGFTSETTYTDCEGDVGGARVKGMVVPVDGKDTAIIGMRGDAFFLDQLDGRGALRFDPIAAADADGNGEVTLDELGATDLEPVRTSGGYDVGDREDITTLRAFVETLTPNVFASFRENGTCTVVSPSDEEDED